MPSEMNKQLIVDFKGHFRNTCCDIVSNVAFGLVACLVSQASPWQKKQIFRHTNPQTKDAYMKIKFSKCLQVGK